MRSLATKKPESAKPLDFDALRVNLAVQAGIRVKPIVAIFAFYACA